MDVKTFINNYKEAFGEGAELPVVFEYADSPVNDDLGKINGCFFKAFETLRKGESISLSVETLGCMGGKFYTGFSEMHPQIPHFVSLKEKYKKTPEMVHEFIKNLGVPMTDKKFLNISPIDKIENFNHILGLIFFATPDMLSGLTTWAFFDNNSDDAVTAKFGSGCSAIITEIVVENGREGRRTFIGLFDPSARPYLEPNILTFSIPMSRFKEMYYTMRQCSLFDTHAWTKVRNRITSNKSINHGS